MKKIYAFLVGACLLNAHNIFSIGVTKAEKKRHYVTCRQDLDGLEDNLVKIEKNSMPNEFTSAIKRVIVALDLELARAKFAEINPFNGDMDQFAAYKFEEFEISVNTFYIRVN